MVRLTVLGLVALLGSLSVAIAAQESTPVEEVGGPGFLIIIELDADGQPHFVVQRAEKPSGYIAWTNQTEDPRHLEIEQEGVVTTKAWLHPNETLEKWFHQAGPIRFELINSGVGEEIDV